MIHTTETIRGTERTVTIVVRYKNEARFIQIPWLTLSKLVEAYQKVREDYQELRKRIQQENRSRKTEKGKPHRGSLNKHHDKITENKKREEQHSNKIAKPVIGPTR
jgi:hypothetical protein